MVCYVLSNTITVCCYSSWLAARSLSYTQSAHLRPGRRIRTCAPRLAPYSTQRVRWVALQSSLIIAQRFGCTAGLGLN